MHAAGSLAALGDIAVFAGLGPDERLRLASAIETIAVSRGDVLIRQNDEADAFYIVVSGRFSVTRHGAPHPIAEIGPGQPVGEIAFLSGRTRTATVTALRDGLVQRLSRADFDQVVARHPRILQVLTETLAGRLAETTAAMAPPPDPKPRTVAIIRAGGAAVPDEFLTRFCKAIDRKARALIVSSSTAADLCGIDDFASAKATAALNALEGTHQIVILVADHGLTKWTEKVIHHADLVLAVGRHGGDNTENALESMAAEFVPKDARRLVVTYPTRTKPSGTANWLRVRRVGMHHHVALDDDEDFARLVRFIMGQARGLVACGGGAWCAAHVGIYKGLKDLGYDYDIMGGTSGGSAMTAAFLMEADLDLVQRSIHAMFVDNKAMRRFTLPWYSIMDHKRFDAELQRLYGDTDIEDLWMPFYAVSTNLSRYKIEVHRSGPVWQAVRASASVPVLFPPVYSSDGEMLVDGCLLDNVPLKTMHDLKSGPNTVISFMAPTTECFDVAFNALPSRREMLMLSLTRGRRNMLPRAPSVISVLMRSLMANRHAFQSDMASDDQLLVPELPTSIGLLDWHKHPELIDTAYQWTIRNVPIIEPPPRERSLRACEKAAHSSAFNINSPPPTKAEPTTNIEPGILTAEFPLA